MDYLPRITEPDENKIHFEAPAGLDQVTLCGLSDWSDEIQQLRGKNLACWCNHDVPCHADVLLEMANS